VISNNQGPYDTIDDTYVAVLNSGTLPITSIVLTSGIGIFAFDGDGICGLSPISGKPYVPGPYPCSWPNPTGYEGPDVSFSNISADRKTATVNFNPPIKPGGAKYFSLENSLTEATACADIINGRVPKPPGGPTTTGVIQTTFTPNNGYALAQAATLCGFSNWDWQQTFTLDSCADVYAAGSTVPLKAPPPYNDPPPNGYSYQHPPNAVKIPVYYNLFTTGPLSLAANETATTLSFFDAPSDPCLSGRTDGTGTHFGITLHLVGIIGPASPSAGVQDTGIGFSYTTTFNGTVGGIAVRNGYLPGGSGTGDIIITNSNNVTSYQYPKAVGVIAINGNSVSSSSTPPTLLGGSQIAVTSSGLAYSRVSHTFNGTVTITNVSRSTIAGPFQIVLDSLTAGVTLTNATSTFGGWSYITVPGVGSLAPGQAATVGVHFDNPSNVTIYFSPIPYSGSFS
jgi:hypothetical protein